MEKLSHPCCVFMTGFVFQLSNMLLLSLYSTAVVSIHSYAQLFVFIEMPRLS